MKTIQINKWKKNTINKEKLIKDALFLINSVQYKTLFIVDSKKNFKLLGSLTEGDIRRALINGFKISDQVIKIYNKSCHYVKRYDEITKKYQIFDKYMVKLVPLTDKQKKIKKIYFLSKKNGVAQIKDNPIIIMAGGKGTRLGKITKKTPKPLILINKTSLLEKLINQIIYQNYKNIFVSIHYMAHKFKNISNFYKKEKINFIEEKKPLGTAGSIKLVKNKMKRPIVIINSDIITNFDLEKILNFHKETKSKLTIVGKEILYQNPFGVLLTSNKGILKKIIEKPKSKFLIAAGIYVVDDDIKNLIKSNQKLDMDKLILNIKSKKKKISVYTPNDYWHEIGTKNILYEFIKYMK